MGFLLLLFFFLIIIPSSILHEYAHGWTADYLGDPTARYAGRLSLNPRVHVDKWGTLFMPLILAIITKGTFIFAYAKPVPYNPYNLKNQKWGPVWVALAGPLSNILLALLFGITFIFLPISQEFKHQVNQVISMGGINGLVYLLNNVSNLGWLENFSLLCSIIVYANVLLAIFNLVPIPPLDGSKVLYAVLPDSQYQLKIALEKYGFYILLFFIFFGFQWIQPIISYLTGLFTGGVGF